MAPAFSSKSSVPEIGIVLIKRLVKHVSIPKDKVPVLLTSIHQKDSDDLGTS
jgi:hypothetical protein